MIAQPTAANNRMALASAICGLTGWLIAALLFCFNLTIGTLIAFATFGIGNLCLIPLSCIAPSLWIAGAVTGHVGINQIKTTGEGGRGLAITGLISSYLGLALILCSILALVLLMLTGAGAGFLQQLQKR